MRAARKVTTASAVSAIALIIAGCGSSASHAAATTSSQATPTSAASITKADFVAKANALCAENNAELGNAAHQAFGDQQPNPGQWQPFAITTVVPIVDKRIQSLDALPTPTADHDQIKAIVSAGEQAITGAQQNPQLLAPNSRAPFEHFDDLASAYGLTDCVVGG